jgi:hypothetical protein
MSFVTNGGKFKLYAVLNGLIFPTPTQPRISQNKYRNYFFVVKENKNCKNAGLRGRTIFWSAFETRCRQKLTEIGKCDTTMWDKVF